MYCRASATLWMKSSCRIVAMGGSSVSAAAVLAAAGSWPRDVQTTLRHDAVDRRHGERGSEERDVDHGLRDQHLRIVRIRVDECLEQVNRRDADDRGRELDLEHAGVDVRQPLRLVGMALEPHPGH